MAISSRVEPVGTVAVRLSSVPSDNRSDQSIVVVARDGDVTLGGDATVVAGQGVTVGPTGDLAMFSGELQPGEALWAIAAAAVQVAVIEGGV